MRRMRLPYLRKAAPDVLATARAQRWDPAEVLRVLQDLCTLSPREDRRRGSF